MCFLTANSGHFVKLAIVDYLMVTATDSFRVEVNDFSYLQKSGRGKGIIWSTEHEVTE